MRCPKCRKGILVTDASLAELYCQRCGAVVEEKQVDTKDGLFEFADENEQGARKPTRQPTSWLHPYKNLGTERKFRASAVEESYGRAYGDFQLLWGQLRLPMHVRVYSALLWRRCYREGLTKGRSTPALAAAIVSHVCADAGNGHTIERVAETVGASVETAKSYYKTIFSRFEGTKRYKAEALEAIGRAIAKLNIDASISRLAAAYLHVMVESDMVGRRRPNAAAAAALYSACRQSGARIEQESISKALGVTEKGIRRARWVSLLPGKGRTLRVRAAISSIEFMS